MRMNNKTKLKRIFLNKKALSPAIATALLLVITIALVAAVSYAATNIVPSNKNINTPKAVFNVQIYAQNPAIFFYGSITIQEISGDTINTADLKLIFTDTLAGVTYTTDVLPCTLTTAEIVALTPGALGTATATSPTGPNTDYALYTGTGTTTYPATYYQSPWLYIPGEFPFPVTTTTAPLWFGQYTISPGSVMKGLGEGPAPATAPAAPTQYSVAYGSIDDVTAMISNFYSLTAGNVVSVSMVYTPSNQIIWQGDVTVG